MLFRSYAVSGAAADAIGKLTGRGVGRGAATVILAAGICQAAIALFILLPKSIKDLELHPLKEE